MKIDTSLSAENINLLVLTGGLLAAFILWQVISGRVAELSYEQVVGQVSGQTDMSVAAERLRSLPIVEARTPVSKMNNDKLSDQAIEAAFRTPVFAAPRVEAPVEVVEEEEESSVITLDQLFLMQYRPLIGGINDSGAIINGHYWRTGDSLETMPVQDVQTGETYHPRLKKVSPGAVLLSLADTDVSVSFERF